MADPQMDQWQGLPVPVSTWTLASQQQQAPSHDIQDLFFLLLVSALGSLFQFKCSNVYFDWNSFTQVLHYCRGMDKPRIYVKMSWRHPIHGLRRLSSIIHLLKLPTQFWNMSLSFCLLHFLIISSYLDRLLMQGPLLDFGRNPVFFPCVWLYRQGLLTPWSRNRLLVDLSLCLLVTSISHMNLPHA